MCRFLAYISPSEPCLLSDVLITPQNAIIHQIYDHYLPGLLPEGHEHRTSKKKDGLIWTSNSMHNIDGMGLAWYTNASQNFNSKVYGPRPALYKSITPPMNDFNFKAICENTETKCLFGHVRSATGTAVVEINSHPFTFGRQTFMHNGTVGNFGLLKRDLCQYLTLEEYAGVKGTTDSEHVAALYVHFLTGGKGSASWEYTYTVQQMADAVSSTIDHICREEKKILETHPEVRAALPTGLNLMVTDGSRLVAVRFRDSTSLAPASLYWSNTAGVTLNRKYPRHPNGPELNTESTKDPAEHGDHVIVSSEPTTFDEKEWHLMKQNEMILVDEDGKFSFEPCLLDWEEE